MRAHPAILLLTLLLPLAFATPLLDHPTAAVAVQDSPTTVFVSWTPVVGSSTGYVVYGVDNGTATSLATVSADTTSTDVPIGYASYAVGNAGDGAAGASTTCVLIMTMPPPGSVSLGIPDCLDVSIG